MKKSLLFLSIWVSLLMIFCNPSNSTLLPIDTTDVECMTCDSDKGDKGDTDWSKDVFDFEYDCDKSFEDNKFEFYGTYTYEEFKEMFSMEENGWLVHKVVWDEKTERWIIYRGIADGIGGLSRTPTDGGTTSRHRSYKETWKWHTDFSYEYAWYHEYFEMNWKCEYKCEPPPPNPVPEPATMFLFGTGLVGLAGTMKKRIKDKNK